MFSAIYSRTPSGHIGNGDKLIKTVRKDFDWFIQHTMNKTIIMGGSTYRSIGRPLRGRRMVVLTRDESLKDIPYIKCYNTFEDLVANERHGVIIGGAQIFKLFERFIYRYYETIIETDLIGDILAPDLSDFYLFKTVTDKDVTENETVNLTFNTWELGDA